MAILNLYPQSENLSVCVGKKFPSETLQVHQFHLLPTDQIVRIIRAKISD